MIIGIIIIALFWGIFESSCHSKYYNDLSFDAHEGRIWTFNNKRYRLIKARDKSLERDDD